MLVVVAVSGQGVLVLLLSAGHVPEVEAIAVRAERDVKVESAIKNFEEVWLSKLFDLTDYQRSYPTTRTEVCTIMSSVVQLDTRCIK